MLTFAQFIRNLRTFVVKSALSRLRAFWEALLAKIWWGEAQKHFKGPGISLFPLIHMKIFQVKSEVDPHGLLGSGYVQGTLTLDHK